MPSVNDTSRPSPLAPRTSPPGPDTYRSSSAQQLDAAVEHRDFEVMGRVLRWAESKLDMTPPGVTQEEVRELLHELPQATAAAEAANQWSILEIILSVLTLGIPFLVDALSENDHEKAEALAARVRQKLDARAAAPGPEGATSDRPAAGRPPAETTTAPTTSGSSGALTPPATGGVGVRVTRPEGALEARNFDRLIDKLGLTRAIADGVITEDEAHDVGIAMSIFQRQAQKSGDSGAIDGYVELIGLEKENSPVRSIPADRLLDPTNSADYIVFAPRELQESLVPLLNHRALEGHKVAMVDPEDVARLYGQRGPEGLARLIKEARSQWSEPTPRYILLAGDSRGAPDAVPTFQEDTKKNGHMWMYGKTFASDNRFGDMDGDGVPELAVGRLPADNAAEMQSMVERIIAYEAVRQPGLWQTRSSIVDGDPSWTPFINNVVDWFTRQEMGALPEDMATRRESFNRGASPIGSSKDSDVQHDYNEGALLISYVGHGSESWTDGIQSYDVARYKPKEGAPIVALTACLTGSYDNTDSLTEELLKADGPAVAAVGASEISVPTNNAAWARVFGQEVLAGKEDTIGDAFVQAKERLANNDVGGWSGFIQALADFFLWVGSLFGWSSTTRKSHLYMYNLMGDPAMHIRRPQRLEDLPAPEGLRAGGTGRWDIPLPAGVKDGVAFVTVEKPLGETAEPMEDPFEKGISPDETRARQERNARRYNERSIATVAVPIKDGKVAADIPIPPNARPGNYNVRVAIVTPESVQVGVVEDVRVRGRR